jgi:hypothetical protein
MHMVIRLGWWKLAQSAKQTSAQQNLLLFRTFQIEGKPFLQFNVIGIGIS